MAQKIWKRSMTKSFAIFLALTMASCGTLMYPERRGQPPGHLDAGVVALDAVGLLLFFVPGVIAFAVDFATGTIYLPPEPPYAAWVASARHWQAIRVPPGDLTPQRLEEIVGEQTGQPVHLEPGTYRAARIEHVEDATPATLDSLRSAPAPTNVVFRGTSR